MNQDQSYTADWYGAGTPTTYVLPEDATLLDPRLTQLGGFVDRSHVEEGKPYWLLAAAWITVNGSHEGAPDWHRQFLNPHLGGDHHVYGLTLSQTGIPYVGKGYRLTWPGGHHDTMGRPEWDHWANAAIGPSGYDPLKTPGPYCWHPGPSSVAPGYEMLCGIGLPYVLPWLAEEDRAFIMGGHHVSWLGVWTLAEPGGTPASRWVPVNIRINDFVIPGEWAIRER